MYGFVFIVLHPVMLVDIISYRKALLKTDLPVSSRLPQHTCLEIQCFGCWLTKERVQDRLVCDAQECLPCYSCSALVTNVISQDCTANQHQIDSPFMVVKWAGQDTDICRTSGALNLSGITRQLAVETGSDTWCGRFSPDLWHLLCTF